jgi:hypothetical protein
MMMKHYLMNNELNDINNINNINNENNNNNNHNYRTIGMLLSSSVVAPLG